MTLPRSKTVDPVNPGHYHVYTRCVRRAWLCGLDPMTGNSYDHRRDWIEERLLFLCRRFAVELYSYAILSNHYHLVVRLDPLAPCAWTDRQVAERWLELFPLRAGPHAEERHAVRLAAILENRQLLSLYRARLGSLSWLMRLLNEHIARRANREDGCKGRFWEGRFQSQALLDDRAVLAAAAYVDLNPVRAGATSDALRAPHTAIHRRLTDMATERSAAVLPPIAAGGPRPGWGLPIGLPSYCELLLWTAAQAHSRSNTSQWPREALARAGGASAWLAQVMALRQRNRRAFGNLTSLLEYARLLGQRWVKGVGFARRTVQADALDQGDL